MGLDAISDRDDAVVAAVFLGERNGLSASVRESYAVAGASHVLALSGLHLGIIFFVLSSLLGRYRNTLLAQLLLLLPIWVMP